MMLTTKVLEHLLRLNEGFTWTTSYSGKNFSETGKYLISGGGASRSFHRQDLLGG